MDCCKYGEYRAPAHAAYGGAVGAAWDGYYAPYAPYTPAYYAPAAHAHAHDPYARYYRYDYPAHHPHAEHAMHMDYVAYASKETRVRRSISRRERPLLPPQHPHTPTPPLECGMNGRGPAYCEPQMWPHYQMGVHGGGGSWNGGNPTGASWPSRGSCAREHMRYPSDCRPIKVPHPHVQNQACLQDGRSTPYRAYDEPFNDSRQGPLPADFPGSAASVEQGKARERQQIEARRSPPEEKRPPVVPLPAFQQAFGSTEIGKFAEAFSRTELPHEDADDFPYDTFPEWDAPPEPQWSSQPAPREIKCEDTY